MGQKGNN